MYNKELLIIVYVFQIQGNFVEETSYIFKVKINQNKL